VNEEEIYKMNVTVENKIVRGLWLQIETEQPTRKENKLQHFTLLLKRFCYNTCQVLCYIYIYIYIYTHTHIVFGWFAILQHVYGDY